MIRSAYLDGLAAVRHLYECPELEARWDRPSALAGMAVSALAGHLSLSATQVERFLAVEHPESHRVDAITYYARLTDTAVPDTEFNQGILGRAAEEARWGPSALRARFNNVAAALGSRLGQESPGRTVAIAHRPGEITLLDEYLRTRCVELSVHLDDLAISLDVAAEVPDTTARIGAYVLFGAAIERHSAYAALMALSRRERATHDTLRVL